VDKNLIPFSAELFMPITKKTGEIKVCLQWHISLLCTGSSLCALESYLCNSFYRKEK